MRGVFGHRPEGQVPDFTLEGRRPRLPTDVHRSLRRCSSSSLTSSWCSTGGGNNPSSTSLRRIISRISSAVMSPRSRYAWGTRRGANVSRGCLAARIGAQCSDGVEEHPAMTNGPTPISFRSSAVRAWQDLFVNLVLAECGLYRPRPRPCSQTKTSMTTPTISGGPYHCAERRDCLGRYGRVPKTGHQGLSLRRAVEVDLPREKPPNYARCVGNFNKRVDLCQLPTETAGFANQILISFEVVLTGRAW